LTLVRIHKIVNELFWPQFSIIPYGAFAFWLQ
jgi:hypothetical protein